MLRMILCLCMAALAGCSDMKIESFAGTEPKLVLEQYLSGRTRAFGILFSRSGEVKRQFVVDMEGKWDGKTLTLEEHFTYSDGEKQERTWVVTKLDEHTYEGVAGDVVGKARGKQYGSALNWSYVLRLPVGSRTYDITFDDWMYLGSEGTMLNRATMTKFGFRVGELFLAFHRID